MNKRLLSRVFELRQNEKRPLDPYISYFLLVNGEVVFDDRPLPEILAYIDAEIRPGDHYQELNHAYPDSRMMCYSEVKLMIWKSHHATHRPFLRFVANLRYIWWRGIECFATAFMFSL